MHEQPYLLTLSAQLTAGWGLCRQVLVTVDGRQLATAAVKGDEPQYDETLEFFLVAPQLEDGELAIQIEVRDIHMADDVKVLTSSMPPSLSQLGSHSGLWHACPCPHGNTMRSPAVPL